jgi:hypothetical protein
LEEPDASVDEDAAPNYSKQEMEDMNMRIKGES